MSTFIYIIIYLIGYFLSYVLIRRTIIKNFDEYLIRDRVLNIIMSLGSWLMVTSVLIISVIISEKNDRPANW